MNHQGPRQMEVLLPKPFDHGFDYTVPANMDVPAGSWVRVPFGRQELYGMAWGAGTQDVPVTKLKPIAGVVENLPVCSDAFRQFIDWVSAYTLAPRGMVLKMAMPVLDVFDPPSPPTHYGVGVRGAKLTPARENVLSVLADGIPRTVADLAEAASVSDGVVRAMAKAGLLAERAPDGVRPPPPRLIPQGPLLSPAQRDAADMLIKQLGSGFSTTLIDGVTGSGKTEVYFEVVEQLLKERRETVDRPSNNAQLALESLAPAPHSHETATPNTSTRQQEQTLKKPQTLVLLPEIALSVQWVERFTQRFGFAPTVWHSGLTPSQRRDAWRAIVMGEAQLVVGARSALFLPYANLQLVVVDEEHEASYKQEEGVMYHARDMAVARGFHEKIPVVLASATPALETVQNVQTGKYESLHLPSRHGGASLPDVTLVDMRLQAMDSGTWLSPDLRQALTETLNAKRQSLLFLNRRGYAPLLLCRACGHRFACPDCTSWLVVHGKTKLMCHHCGYHTHVPEKCPACEVEAKLVPCGPGVERVEEEARLLFPGARIEAMTSDSADSLKDATRMVQAMQHGEVDILIGTQMVAKGHHFPALDLIGVVDADLGLSGGDLRAVERTYQLLHQVAGRAGREGAKGRVLMQTYMPEHPVMQALQAYDRDGLQEMELESRRDAGLPPFGRLAAVVLDGAFERDVLMACRRLSASFPHHVDVQVLGPAPAPLKRLRGRFRYRFLLKAPRAYPLQIDIARALETAAIDRRIRVRVDVDPYRFT